MASSNNEQLTEYKDSFFKMASSAISASKTGWTRARQFTEEKIGNAEKTQYDAQFENLCARADRTKQLTEKLLKQTEAMLQPNPGVRMEEFVYEKLDRRNAPRPTNAFVLGQTLQEGGQEIGPGTGYGSALTKVGGSLKKIGNAERDFMDKSMSGFLQPLRSFLDNEMKTITKERRQLEIKRLDLDACKTKVKKSSTPEKMREAENELRRAQSDFDRQYELTKLLLEAVATSQMNHLSAINTFVEALGMYHTQCQQYATELQKNLSLPSGDRPSRPPPARPSAPILTTNTNGLESTLSMSKPSVTRRAKVLYDYDAADQNELSLLADEVVNVYSVEGLDSDWMIAERGALRGKVPIAYLELL